MSDGADPSASIDRIAAALARLDAATREPATPAADAPIFLASIGWRSGSTLVQRTLMTDCSTLIWGEPLGHMALVGRLSEQLMAVTADWPPDDHWLSHRPDVDLVRDWVANLSPDPGRLKGGYHAFMDQWLARPALDRGFSRWGVKEVRWTAVDALVLRWLYPKAHFLLLVRHPLAAYGSMKNFGLDPPAYGFLDRWPADWVLDADTWGRFWNERAVGWATVASQLNAHLIRYEDLVAGRVDLRAIGGRLGLHLEPQAAAESRVGGPLFDRQVTDDEAALIQALTAEGRRAFAYAG
jgi:hypothetical protein